MARVDGGQGWMPAKGGDRFLTTQRREEQEERRTEVDAV